MNYFTYYYKDLIPEGYVAGLVRNPRAEIDCVAHLYKGDFVNVGDPMCKRGWNRGKGGYSVWRNVIGRKGICAICLRRARANLNPIPFPYEDEKEK